MSTLISIEYLVVKEMATNWHANIEWLIILLKHMHI